MSYFGLGGTGRGSAVPEIADSYLMSIVHLRCVFKRSSFDAGSQGGELARLRGWADGLYLARVVSNGAIIGETKCAVGR